MAINTVTGSGAGTTLLGPHTGKKGKGKAKGLFRPGKGGEIAAQQHPQNYFNVEAGLAGGLGTGNAGYEDWLANSAYGDVYTHGYQRALAGNEKLMFRDWLKQATASGAGPSGNLGQQLQQGYKDFASTNDSQGYYAAQLAGMGLTGPNATGGMAPDAQASYNNAYNGYYANWLNKSYDHPGYTFAESLAGHDAPTGEIFTGTGTYKRDKRHGKPPKKKGNGAGGTTAGSVL